MMKNNNLIVIVGPTGIGKTSLAISIANHFSSEIVSADSRQFFNEMTIGTAVPSTEELAAAPHHFIQHKSIFDHYSVGDFEREATSFLTNYFKERDVAIMVGGSGLYIKAVTEGLDKFPNIEKGTRDILNNQLKKEGLGTLQYQLKLLDPLYYNSVDLDNPHRIIRALEVCLSSGKPYSSYLNQEKEHRDFKTIYVGINAERDLIYDRINQRVDVMMQQGLLNEAKELHTHASLNALQTVGYRELFSYLNGDNTIEGAIEEIKKNTRRFAKRQLTWNRKLEDVLWVDYHMDAQRTIKLIEQKLRAT